MISNVFRGALRRARALPVRPLRPFGLYGGAGCAAPAIYRIGTITVEQPWSRATPGERRWRPATWDHQHGRRAGPARRRHLPAARRFELHEMSVGTDNVMRMRPLKRARDRARRDRRPEAGGFHAMFLDLDRALKEGESLAGTLRFEKAGTVAVTYAVGGLGAQGPSAGHHGHH